MPRWLGRWGARRADAARRATSPGPARSGIVFGLLLLEALDDTGELFMVESQVLTSDAACVRGPLPVLRRRHQEI